MTFKEIINQDRLVLVDFYATWCGPCKMMHPILDELKAKKGDEIQILKVDVDKNPQASQAYQVSGVPTLILFRKGTILWRQSGALSLPALEKVLQPFL